MRTAAAVAAAAAAAQAVEEVVAGAAALAVREVGRFWPRRQGHGEGQAP